MRRKFYSLLFCTLSLIAVLNVYAQSDPGTENLMHSWTFGDGTANDMIGNAHGTLMGDAYVDNGSLFTDYPPAWMELPADQIAINSYPEVTLEVWFKSVASGNTGYHMLVYFGDTQNSLGVNDYFITPARGDDRSRAAISCGVYTNPWTGESGANGPELDDGLLHHMVSTLSDTNITLYVDGKLQASTSLASNNKIDSIRTTYAYLAKSGYTGDSTWVGEILEFNIYNKALDSLEVLFLYNKVALPTGIVNERAALPKDYSLSQNYPNPFNPSTIVTFDIPENLFVSLKVYNTLGEEIAELAGKEYAAGKHSVPFNASKLASGVYFYAMRAGNFSTGKKMLLQK